MDELQKDNPGGFLPAVNSNSLCKLLKIHEYHPFHGQDNGASEGKAAAKRFCDHISRGLS